MVNGQAFHLGLRTQKCDLQTQSVWETWKGACMDGHGCGVCGGWVFLVGMGWKRNMNQITRCLLGSGGVRNV